MNNTKVAGAVRGSDGTLFSPPPQSPCVMILLSVRVCARARVCRLAWSPAQEPSQKPQKLQT